MTLKRGPKFNREERANFVSKLRELLKDKSLNIKEAAEKLGVSANYAYRIAKKQKLPYNNVSKQKVSNVLESKETGFTIKELCSIYKLSSKEVENIIHDPERYQREKTTLFSKEHQDMGQELSSRQKEN